MTKRELMESAAVPLLPEDEKPPHLQITTTGHGMQTGDVVTMPIRWSRWERFLLWLASPFRWPPKEYQGRYVVTAVSGSNSFEVDYASR